jgi:hypothetical protein
MIFGYFDESGESGEGFFVVAGFVGRRKDWKNFLSNVAKGIGELPSFTLGENALGFSEGT